MATVSHQTVKLSKGKHTSPEEGACVMELSSMLAGEQFTDRPASVCPLIGSFLRSYNDFLDDDRRQDLHLYAARVVGSRGTSEAQNSRAEHLAAWIAGVKQRRLRWFFLPRPLAWFAEVAWDPIDIGSIFELRGRSSEAHAEILALLDELLAIGTGKPSDPEPKHPVEPMLSPVI